MSFQYTSEPGPLASLMARIMGSERPPARAADARLQSWRNGLPEHLSTRALEHADPDALIQIVKAWSDRRMLKPLFHRLLFQNKLMPRTYSFEVLNEIAALREYAIVVVHKEPATIWDQLHESRF
jgi:hypothetical protein